MNRLRQSNLLYLILAPWPAVTLGAWVMARADVGTALWIQNLLAVVVGSGAAALVIAGGHPTPRWDARRRVPPLFSVFPVLPLLAVGAAGLFATLLVPGVEGVHRWLPVGPLRIHVGAVVLPAMLVLFPLLSRRVSALFALLTAGFLFAQPDLAQAGAFATAWSLIALLEHRGRAALGVLLACGVAAVSWFRPDPLEPVPHVEGIVGLALEQHAGLGLLSVLALLLVPLVPLVFADRPHGFALASYFTATMLASWLGHYPVPVLGYGVSPILGYYCAVVTLGRGGLRAVAGGTGVVGRPNRRTVHWSDEEPGAE